MRSLALFLWFFVFIFVTCSAFSASAEAGAILKLDPRTDVEEYDPDVGGQVALSLPAREDQSSLVCFDARDRRLRTVVLIPVLPIRGTPDQIRAIAIRRAREHAYSILEKCLKGE